MENKTLSVGRCAERTAATYCDLEGSGENPRFDATV